MRSAYLLLLLAVSHASSPIPCAPGQYYSIALSACTACLANTTSYANATVCAAMPGYYDFEGQELAYYSFNPLSYFTTDIAGGLGTLTNIGGAYSGPSGVPNWIGGENMAVFTQPGSLAYNSPSRMCLTAPTLQMPAVLSVCAWYYPSSLANYARVWSFSNGAYVNEITFGRDSSTSNALIRIYDGSGNLQYSYSVPSGMMFSQWNHMCAIVAANNVTVYLNGAQVLAYTPAQPITFATSLAQNYLACSPPGSTDGLFAGYIDEVRIFKRALSVLEVQAVYSYRGDGYAALIVAPCPANTYSAAQGAVACAACSTNMQSAPGSVACVAMPGAYGSGLLCGPGTYTSAPGTPSCSPCMAGTYASGSGTSACSACASGMYSPSPGAVACTTTRPTAANCSLGQYYLTGAPNVCVTCPPFTFCDVAVGGCVNACMQCPPHTGSDPTFSTCLSASCVVCPMGSYCSGGTQIQGCPAGTYGSAPGLMSPLNCTACALGQYTGAANATACSNCSGGTYAQQTMSTTCVACSAGTYTVANGSSTCGLCAAGKYSTSTGASSVTFCTGCSQGMFATATGASSSSTCVSCAIGTYATGTALTSSAACSLCAAGTYATGTGAVTSSVCTTCPSGTFQVYAGSSTCVACMQGYYSGLAGATTPAACTACPAYSNTSANASTLASQCLCMFGAGYNGTGCTPCPLGSYKNVFGNTPCSLCPAGTYDSQVNGIDPVTQLLNRIAPGNCQPDPSNAWSTNGSGTFYCNAGYYLVSVPGYAGLGVAPFKCTACPYGSYAQVNSTACTGCANGTTAATATTSAGNCSCNGGFYQAGSGCVPCMAGFWCAGGSTNLSSLTPCRQNSWSNGGGVGVRGDCTCNAGYYGTDQQCVQCPAGQWCPGGNGNTSSTCPGNTSSPIGSTSVMACVCLPGYASINSSVGENINNVVPGVPCVACTPNVLCVSGTKIACPTNAFSNASKNPCVCSPGYYNYSAAGCTLCPYGSYCTGGFNTSTGGVSQCPAYSNTSVRGASSLSACSCVAGTVYQPGSPTFSCFTCAAGSYCGVGGIAQSCGNNAFSPPGSSNASQCTCNAGYFGTPIPQGCGGCPGGTYSSATGLTAASQCTNCSAGTYSIAVAATNATVCTSCAPGMYGTGTGMLYASNACLNCGVGKYSTAVGAGAVSACQSCPPMTNTTVVGATNVSMCYCAPGYGSYAGVCAICPPGTFKGTILNISCTACAANTYDNSSFSGTDIFGNSVRLGSNCINVPNNSFSFPGSFTFTCNAGYFYYNPYVQGVQPTCQPCTPGTFATGTGLLGALNCTACSAGTYSTGLAQVLANVCTQCAPGTYSTGIGVPSSASCARCAAGTIATGSGASSQAACVPCAPGYYSSATGSAVPCTQCGPGTYSTATGASTYAACTYCPAGTYNMLSGQPSASSCVKCAPGTASTALAASAPSQCTSCAPGSFSGFGWATCSYCYYGNVLQPF